MDSYDMDASDSELSFESEEEEVQEQEQITGRKEIYRHEELHEKLEDVMWEGTSFLDTQATTCSPEENISNIDDDLQRELYFYTQALTGARGAVKQLEKAGVPWLRPTDFYAEMVKSDAHMSRVKQQLMYEQKKIDESEERRKQRENKKAMKELQAERLKEKAQAKKQNISQVDRLRKQRQRSGFAGELDMDAQLNAMNRRNSKDTGQRITPGDKRLSKRRAAKNAHFGFGGRKRLQKQNDSSSAADMNAFHTGGGGGRKGKKGPQRPGKARRAAARGR